MATSKTEIKTATAQQMRELRKQLLKMLMRTADTQRKQPK